MPAGQLLGLDDQPLCQGSGLGRGAQGYFPGHSILPFPVAMPMAQPQPHLQMNPQVTAQTRLPRCSVSCSCLHGLGYIPCVLIQCQQTALWCCHQCRSTQVLTPLPFQACTVLHVACKIRAKQSAKPFSCRFDTHYCVKVWSQACACEHH